MSRQEKVIYALGFFDGVHKGHQAILETALKLARETGMRPGVFTYENHPQSVVGGSAPPLLTTPEERRALFAHYGMEEIVMIPFDAHFSAQSPEEFLRMLTTSILAPKRRETPLCSWNCARNWGFFAGWHRQCWKRAKRSAPL